jgi:hypothetical protein
MLLLLFLAGFQQFRITLNAPAARLVVGDVPAIEMEAEAGVVRLRPTRSKSGFALSPRGSERGGLEAVVSGPKVQDILGTMMTISGQQQRKPIFALEKDTEKAGWYRLVYCREAPGRHIPQLRLWLRTDAAHEAEPEPVPDEPEWANQVRRAFKLVAAHEEGGRIGRPPKDVVTAQAVVAVFRQLAIELLPPQVDRQIVEQARDTLDRALKPDT